LRNKIWQRFGTLRAGGKRGDQRALVQWLRDNLESSKSSDVEVWRAPVKDMAILFCPGIQRTLWPYWKDSARGVIAGLTRYANKGHLARRCSRLRLTDARCGGGDGEDARIELKTVRVDGGMVGNEL